MALISQRKESGAADFFNRCIYWSMENMQFKNVPCNLCGADDYTVIYPSKLDYSTPTVLDYTSTVNKYGVFHNIVRCNQCQLLYMNPRDVNIKDLYKDVCDQSYLDSWDERIHTFKNHIKILKRYKFNPTILDMGCYVGIFMEEAKKAGFTVNGIEPSAWAVEYAHKRTGAPVTMGTCDDKQHFPAESFDIVTLWDVIEHLENPSACLNNVFTCLKQDGIVAVTTHDIGSLMARIMGPRYPWLMRFHLYHFTPKTLSALLRKNNIEPIYTTYYSKKFSLSYLLSRFGISTKSKIFKKINIPVYTHDMFMIIGQKKSVSQ